MLQPFSGFWERLPKPIIGLSPMDGVTDFACRAITARHGRPDVMFTEFTTAEGLFYAPEKILRDFEYDEIERPVVAQIYGHRPEDFYRAAHVVCELGFDGIDINMGCPSKPVVRKNCGAKLITVPDLALEIIRATRAAIQDWASGQRLEELKIPERLLAVVLRMNRLRTGAERSAARRPIPYSVKTRIGYDEVVIEQWVETLLREKPAVISIHGRTLKQMYKGAAQWDAIARAVRAARGSGTLILGNGDVSSLNEAFRLAAETGVDGVLIGRSAIGNPWVFCRRGAITALPPHPPSDQHLVAPFAPFGRPEQVRSGQYSLTVSREERIRVALEHASYYVETGGARDFRSLRKHLVGYLKCFPDAAGLRKNALNAVNLQELSAVLD